MNRLTELKVFWKTQRERVAIVTLIEKLDYCQVDTGIFSKNWKQYLPYIDRNIRRFDAPNIP